MIPSKRTRRIPVVAEVALAYVASAAVFALVAVTVAAIEADVPVLLLAVGVAAGVVAIARSIGVPYAVPVAMASVLAYDWFFIPPTHTETFPDAANLLDLLVYLAVAVGVGQIASHAGRRADDSERAHGLLADEQAALRRVATLVAEGASPDAVFAAVARELALVADLSVQPARLDITSIVRFEPDSTMTVMASSSERESAWPVGSNWPLDGYSVCNRIFRTRAPARLDDYTQASGTVGNEARRQNIRSSVGVPIRVGGEVWGAAAISSTDRRPLPSGIEARIADFGDLVATAISNALARAEADRLASEQAALRRVATLVAEGAPAEGVLAAVANEAGTLLDGDAIRIARYDDREIVQVAGWSRPGYDPPWFERAELDGTSVSSEVLRTGRVARIDDYGSVAERAPFTRELELESSVGAPIVVDGRLWGVMLTWSTRETLPSDAGARLMDFTELVATAIANGESRAEVHRLADEQAALRRVATLVAQQASPERVFAAVVEEVGRMLGVDDTRMVRYEPDGMVSLVASWGELADALPVGTRLPTDGTNVTTRVRRTGRPARMDDYAVASGPVGRRIRSLGIRSAVGTPIVVEGRLWGAMIAASLSAKPLPDDTEVRIGEFTALLGTAIANAEARSDLAASRARIVAATDETRRRFERDLHDGAQQRLVSLSLQLRSAEALAPEELRARLSDVADGLNGVLDDLRELSRGIHPAILSEGGVGPAVRALARRSPVPIQLDVSIEHRLDERVEAAAYFVVSEALTNVAKHAGASRAEIRIEADERTVDVTVDDDGVGGADPSRGTGLVGLRDRVEALGGTISVASPAGDGTRVRVALPLDLPASRYAETPADLSRR